MNRPWTVIKAGFACAWSAWTYIFNGMPSDKQSYFKNFFGFYDDVPELVAAWEAVKANPSFHLLKDLWVEWVKAWPQRAGKLLALLVVLAYLLGLATSGVPLGNILAL